MRGISKLGDSFFDVLIMWLIYNETGSTFAAAGVTIADRAATIGTSLISGAFIDKLNRKKIMISLDIARALAVFLLAITAAFDLLNTGLVLATVFVLQILSQFFSQTATTFIPRIISRNDLATAQGLMSSSQTAVETIGKSAAGFVVGIMGAFWIFVLNAFSFVLGAWGIVALPNDSTRQESSSEEEAGTARFWNTLKEGWYIVVSIEIFKSMMVITLMANLVAITALIPAIVTTNLNSGAEIYGLIEGITLVGVVVGGLMAGSLDRTLGTGSVWILSLSTMSIALVGIGASHVLWLTLILFFLLGVAESALSVPVTALVQSTVPEEYLGRAFGFLGAASSILAPVGAAAFGLIGDIWNPAGTFVLAGIWTGLTSVLALSNPKIRNASLMRGW